MIFLSFTSYPALDKSRDIKGENFSPDFPGHDASRLMQSVYIMAKRS